MHISMCLLESCCMFRFFWYWPNLARYIVSLAPRKWCSNQSHFAIGLLITKCHEQWHYYTYSCIEMIRAQQFFTSVHFSRLYNSLWLTKWLEIVLFMMTSSNGSIFCVTGPLCHRWISPKKGQRSEALMVSLICAWTNRCVTIQTPVIWNAFALIMTSL